MSYIKKFLSSALVLAMIITTVPNAFAVGTSTSTATEVINQYVEALNNRDWNSIIEVSPDEEYQENVAFYYSEEYAQESIGFHAVTSASIATITELDGEDLYNYTNAAYYFSKYGTLKLYLIGIDLAVNKESKYFYNGVNFFLVALGLENNAWKVVLFSQAPASVIEENMNTAQTFSGDDVCTDNGEVEMALDIIRARYQGVVLGSEGNIIETNIASVEELAEEKGIDSSDIENSIVTATVTNLTRPSTVAVYITDTSSSNYGTIQNVELYDYCKNVLPNEWIGSWKTESLKAGAQAVKFVAWYCVYNAKYPGKGYDVKDSTADQVYKPGTEYSTCTSAINAVGGIGMLNSSGELFYPSYRAGTSGSAGTAHGGIMYQYGSQYLATSGYNYNQILNYYYSNSSVSAGALTTFSY